MTHGEAISLIDAAPDYRLLRRVPVVGDWRVPARQGETRRALFVDSETTGLDLERDQVIELALVPFDYERDGGRIVAVHNGQAFSCLREPSFPIPAESTCVHGITDADVKGKSVDSAAVAAFAEKAHLVIAHNAAFDRAIMEKHWPLFENKH